MKRKTRGADKINRMGSSQRFHAPRELRTVSTKKSSRGKRVPRICLSGKWLEHTGFHSGVEFLVLADVPHQILLVLTEPRTRAY